MPELDTKTPIAHAQSSDPTRAHARDEIGTAIFAGPPPLVRRLILIPVIGAVIVLFVQIGDWQLLASAGCPQHHRDCAGCRP